jgi:hypothetical protein
MMIGEAIRAPPTIIVNGLRTKKLASMRSIQCEPFAAWRNENQA